MVYLILLLSCLLTACTVLLLVRLYREERSLRGTPADEFGMHLRKWVRRLLDESLLARAGAGGLRDIALPYCEAHDRVKNTAEVLHLLVARSGATRFGEVIDLVKYLYEFQYALGFSARVVEECLPPLVRRLQAESFLGKRVSRVQVIQVGDLVNAKTMFPLNSGSRVKQPLGVAVFDAEGRVLNKAKVLCS